MDSTALSAGSDNPTSDQDPVPLFRPSKKRKIFRQRANSPVSDESALPTVISTSSANAQTLDELVTSEAGAYTEKDGEQMSMAEILRQRKLQLRRAGGVEFRAAPVALPSRSEDLVDAVSMRENGEEPRDESGGGVRKFTKQTGLVGDVDKHMMAYIDSELAKRRQNATNISKSTTHVSSSSDGANTNQQLPDTFTTTADLPSRQPATLGKLQEIDLGPSATSANISRISKALNPVPSTPPEPKPPKPRIGRNGKPYIPKPRKRRDSDALRRDALVEAVMSENRIEMYEPQPEPKAGGAGGEGDGNADEALEEAFRQEYLDSLAAQRKKKPAAQSGGGSGVKAKDEDVLKGPKLGGSKSQRAAMHDKLLKEQNRLAKGR